MTIVPNITLLIVMAIVLVLMVVLDKLLFKPMMGLLEERKARTAGRRARAEEASNEADGIWESYQASLAEARSGAEATRMELVREGEEERQRMTDAASAEAEKVVTETKAQVQAQAEQAREAVRAEVETLAKAMAEKILGRAV